MSKRLLRLSCIFLIITTVSVYAQKSEIASSYENYMGAPREVAYLHLNKSKYIKGESIGFKAYVLDKNEKRPSLLTTNLYVTLENEDNRILKSKLIRIFDGVGSNLFEIDSSFVSGSYTIKAYTNWMRNFNEQNYFAEKITISDLTSNAPEKNTIEAFEIDAQFLPESGHMLSGIVNKIGVAIKNQKGIGIPNIQGQILDENNNIMTAFETNNFGLASFLLLPEANKKYRADFTYNGQDFSIEIAEDIKYKGVILSYNRQPNRGFLTISTNQNTLEQLKNKKYKLLLHNGKNYTERDIVFDDKLSKLEIIDFDVCPAGMNIATLFDENNTPIAERMFFNHKGINLYNDSKIVEKIVERDSSTFRLQYENISTDNINSLSVSILPSETDSYKRHHNIASYTYLQPYLNNPVQDAKYYFEDTDDKKKYELDNLLLIEGWSSYNWNEIFNYSKEPLSFAFEQGITLRANANSAEKDAKFMILPAPNIEPSVFSYDIENNTYVLPNIFATEGDQIAISKVLPNGKFLPARMYLQSSPNSIPRLDTEIDFIGEDIENVELSANAVSFENLDGVTMLDEVVVKSYINKLRTRTRELSQGRFGQIKIITENDRNTYYYLRDYLIANRVTVEQDIQNGTVRFFGGRGSIANFRGSGQTPMTVYYNDAQLIETGILVNAPLSDFDYIEINRSGIGGGARGNGGELKLYLSQESVYTNRRLETSNTFNIPLKFSNAKTYYTPKYRYRTDDFYVSNGVIDWKPELSLNEKGVFEVKIETPRVPFTLFIEGITNNGAIILEDKSIALN